MFKKYKEDTTYIPDLDKLLQQNISGRILKHEVRPLTKEGENFGSEILSIDITVEENGEEKLLHAVGKLVPPTEMQLEIFNTQVTFKNEIGFYAEVVPALKEFQQQYEMDNIEKYFAKFYGARINLNPASDRVDTDAVIVMENLKISGYGNVNKGEGFDLDTAKLILRSLADFQATALALRKHRPDVFKEKIRKYLSEWKPQEDAGLFDFDNILCENPNTAFLCTRMKKLLTKKRVKEVREPWATITHNDLWVNNVMVKDPNGVIDRVKFVDFQVPDYGSPLTDVIFFLLTSVQAPVLRYHFEKLLSYYYKEFLQTLGRFKVDLKEFTYESFLEEVRKEGSYQTFHSLFMLFPIFAIDVDQKLPGRVPEWNPNGEKRDIPNTRAEPVWTKNVKPKPQDIPPFITPPAMKEHIWFIVEEAAKRGWM